MDLGLKDRSALITGGSRGIGKAIAISLAKEGCNIAVAARGRSDLETTCDLIRELDVQCVPIQADMTVPDDISKMVEGTISELQGIDLLVANAGGQKRPNFEDSTDEDWQFTLDINLMHAIRSIRKSIPYMKRSDCASIVIISSVAGYKVQVPTQYGVAKAAEIYLAAGLARELAQFNIRVNAVAPGSIEFEGGSWGKRQKSDPRSMDQFRNSQFPFKRLGTPEEVADVVTFLCSEKASWISGTTVTVDGGQMNPGLWSPQDLPGPFQNAVPSNPPN
tara:strand:+ start:12253 stop:13083 length:831 start_codon:yes stop_codon:yes gene_type:complete